MSTSIPNPAPLSLATALSPAWLSEALSAGRPTPVTVTGVEVVETLTTRATKIRFNVTFAGEAPDLPTSFCIKGYFDPEGAGHVNAGLVETLFYRHVADGLDIRLPRCFYTGIDEQTGHQIFIMEDLVQAGSVFLTALSPFTTEQVKATLDQLARLHAAKWDSPELATTDWLGSKIELLLAHVDAQKLQQQLDDPRGNALPAEVKDAQRLRRSLGAVLAAGEGQPNCLIHGDAHAGNVFESPTGPGIVDWQIAMRGSWALDVSYHIGAVLSVEERERTEADLLRHYLARLTAHGVRAPEWEQAWLSYRTSMAYGYYLWAITFIVESTITNEFVKRLGTAVSYHKSFELLGV
jgi:thiamine kinase-like enzyme